MSSQWPIAGGLLVARLYVLAGMEAIKRETIFHQQIWFVNLHLTFIQCWFMYIHVVDVNKDIFFSAF